MQSITQEKNPRIQGGWILGDGSYTLYHFADSLEIESVYPIESRQLLAVNIKHSDDPPVSVMRKYRYDNF